MVRVRSDEAVARRDRGRRFAGPVVRVTRLEYRLLRKAPVRKARFERVVELDRLVIISLGAACACVFLVTAARRSCFAVSFLGLPETCRSPTERDGNQEEPREMGGERAADRRRKRVAREPPRCKSKVTSKKHTRCLIRRDNYRTDVDVDRSAGRSDRTDSTLSSEESAGKPARCGGRARAARYSRSRRLKALDRRRAGDARRSRQRRAHLPGARRRNGRRKRATSDPHETGLAAEAIALAVVAEDEALIVIDKPAGLVLHPGCRKPRGNARQRAAPPRAATRARASRGHRTSARQGDERTDWSSPRRSPRRLRSCASSQSRTVTPRIPGAGLRGHRRAAAAIDAPIGRHPTRAHDDGGRPGRQARADPLRRGSSVSAFAHACSAAASKPAAPIRFAFISPLADIR